MKTRALFVAALLTAPVLLSAEETVSTPAAEKPATSGADAAWNELEPLLRGPDPKERPKSREETLGIYKAWLSDVDAKSEAFVKAFPEDSRRWSLVVQTIKTNSLRSQLGQEEKSGEEIGKLLDDVLAAPDADAESKAFASYAKLDAIEDPEAFTAAVETHKKAYPDFRGNAQLDGRVAKIKTQAELKENPLDLKFTDSEGQAFDLADLRGKVVLVDFWATWCGPCIAELPNVTAAYEKLHDKGFEIVGISFENARVKPDAGEEEKAEAKKEAKEKLATFAKEHKMSWPQYFDGEGWDNPFGRKFGITGIPTMWLVNKKGFVATFEGRGDLESKVEKLLAEE